MADCNICIRFIRHRDCVFKELLQCTDYIATYYYFCKKCWQCKVTREYQLEIERKGFKTFNSKKKMVANRLAKRKIQRTFTCSYLYK